jgi:hypothetical protein
LNTILKSATAALGLWLVVSVSVFSSGPALALAFATAIALTSVAAVDAGYSAARGRRYSAAVAAATAAGSAFLIVASLIFEGASLGWLMVIAGSAVQAGVILTLAATGSRRAAVAPVAETSRLAA